MPKNSVKFFEMLQRTFPFKIQVIRKGGAGHRNEQRYFYNREKCESVAELNEKLKKASAPEQQEAYAHIEGKASLDLLHQRLSNT